MTDLEPATGRDARSAGVASNKATDPIGRLPQPRRVQSWTGERDELVQQLEVRLTRLERLLWGTPDGETQLDAVDPELARLAGAAERAHELTRMLVAPEVRTACEQAIESWEQWHHRHREVLAVALAASRTIAITSADQRGRTVAVREFEAARAELSMLRSRRQGYLNAATHARRQLDHDQQARGRSQGDIDAGHLAWATLIARLRVLVATALDHAHPLPAWLVVGLGAASPNGASARWRELATDLLAYRITYSVADRGAPLGAEPTAEDSPRRRRWYAELDRQLVRWAEHT